MRRGNVQIFPLVTANVAYGSKPEKLNGRICFPLCPLRADITQCSRHVRLMPRALTWLLWERMLEEETQHFSRCVRSSRISVGARRTASRPRVPSSVDVPVLKDSARTRVGMNRAGIGMPSRYPPAMYVLLRARRSHRLLKNLIAVVWMHRNVAIAVENNGRDRLPVT